MPAIGSLHTAILQACLIERKFVLRVDNGRGHAYAIGFLAYLHDFLFVLT